MWVLEPAATAGRGRFVAADQQGKLPHPIAVDGFDRTAQLAFAKIDPALRRRAIKAIGEIVRVVDAVRGGILEIDTETAAAGAPHVSQDRCDDVFPDLARMSESDVHDPARDGIVR